MSPRWFSRARVWRCARSGCPDDRADDRFRGGGAAVGGDLLEGNEGVRLGEIGRRRTPRDDVRHHLEALDPTHLAAESALEVDELARVEAELAHVVLVEEHHPS